MRRRRAHRSTGLSDSAVSRGGGGSGGSAGFSFGGGGVQTPGGGAGFHAGGGGGKGGNASRQNGNMEEEEDDMFGCPDSPTQQWLADNADLSPLRVLDNINLKTEFPYASLTLEAEKPPDLTSLTSLSDLGASNLLQFAATVPVPDNGGGSGGFMDLGLESFQSLYEDLGELMTSSGGGDNDLSKPGLIRMFNLEGAGREFPLDLKALGIQIQMPSGLGETVLTPVLNGSTTLVNGPNLKTLVEPIPASALQGLVKVNKNYHKYFELTWIPGDIFISLSCIRNSDFQKL